MTLEQIIQARLFGGLSDVDYVALLRQFYQDLGYSLEEAAGIAQQVNQTTIAPTPEQIAETIRMSGREPTPEEIDAAQGLVSQGQFPPGFFEFISGVANQPVAAAPGTGGGFEGFPGGQPPGGDAQPSDPFIGPAEEVGAVQGPIPPQQLPEELLGGLPAFGRATGALGLDTGPGGGAVGRFFGNQRGPASTAFTARQFLTGGDPGLGGNPFQQFVQQNLLGGGIRQQAGQTFQGLLDLARGGGANALQNQFIAPADFAQGQQAAQLARSAVGNQIGGFALSRFAPSASDIFSAFAQSPQAGNASSFLPFAQKFLGIQPVANAFSGFGG